MNRMFGKLSYKLITHSLRMPVFPLINEFEHAEQMSPDELLRYQWNKLQELIKYAVAHSPYYKKLFADIGAEAEDIKDEASFRKIPCLSKKIIKEKGNEILVRPTSWSVVDAKTSGSTGRPLKIYKDSEGRASAYAAMYRGHRWYGVDVGAREARLWAVPSTTLNRTKSKIEDFMLNRVRQEDIKVCDITFRNFYSKMKQFCPEYLMGYPSLIFLFCTFLKKKEIDGKSLSLKFVKCTAEVLNDFQKNLIEDVFGCPCISEYGATETGVVSFECPARQHHIMAESVFVEFENNEGMEDKFRKMLITNLYNRVFPIIRYKIGDLAYPKTNICCCGRSLPLMSEVVGRIHDAIIDSNGNRFHSSILSTIFKELIKQGFDLKQIRIVQSEIGKIKVQMVKSATFPVKKYEPVKKIIQGAFNDAIYVDTEYCDVLERDPSGKYRYFVSCIDKVGTKFAR